jgi:chitin disaccharide deacetylase
MARLIVNADDFGLTSGVNHAIHELNVAGVLTSATLMARAAAADEACKIALGTSGLGVGCHVVLVDGEPVLPKEKLPTLVDQRTGRFQPTLGKFVVRLLSGRISAQEIEAEATAQLELLKGRGLKLTHVDTHKHTHMFVRVLEPLLRAAKVQGVGAIRNPFEPAWSVAATPDAPLVRRVQVGLLRKLRTGFLRRVNAAGLKTTEGALGVLATGTLNAEAVRALLNAFEKNAAADSTWELVTHPGYNDADLSGARTRLLAQRDVEREASMTLKEFPNCKLVNFGQL